MINGFPFLSEARDGRRKSPVLEEAGTRFSQPAELQIHVWSFPKTHTHKHIIGKQIKLQDITLGLLHQNLWI